MFIANKQLYQVCCFMNIIEVRFYFCGLFLPKIGIRSAIVRLPNMKVNSIFKDNKSIM